MKVHEILSEIFSFICSSRFNVLIKRGREKKENFKSKSLCMTGQQKSNPFVLTVLTHAGVGWGLQTQAVQVFF